MFKFKRKKVVYWYDDFSENLVFFDCNVVLIYSLPFYNDNLNIFGAGGMDTYSRKRFAQEIVEQLERE